MQLLPLVLFYTLEPRERKMLKVNFEFSSKKLKFNLRNFLLDFKGGGDL